MRSVLELVALDVAYRAGKVDDIGRKPKKEDVADLRALWKAMEGGDLGTLRPPMSLNPEFGEASDLVGGADADIVAGGDLIDIKTVMSPIFKREHFDQLAGYAILNRLAGGPNFRRIGVYFSRYGLLEWVDADRVYGKKFDDFLPVFKSMAAWMFGEQE